MGYSLWSHKESDMTEQLNSTDNVRTRLIKGFPCGSDIKDSAYNAGGLGSIPGSGRCPGEGNDNPLQYSCLENRMDRGLQSMGSQRVRHDRESHTHTCTFLWASQISDSTTSSPGWNNLWNKASMSSHTTRFCIFCPLP